MNTAYDRMYGIFPAKNAVHTPYIHLCVWFWPTLLLNCRPDSHVYRNQLAGQPYWLNRQTQMSARKGIIARRHATRKGQP